MSFGAAKPATVLRATNAPAYSAATAPAYGLTPAPIAYPYTAAPPVVTQYAAAPTVAPAPTYIAPAPAVAAPVIKYAAPAPTVAAPVTKYKPPKPGAPPATYMAPTAAALPTAQSTIATGHDVEPASSEYPTIGGWADMEKKMQKDFGLNFQGVVFKGTFSHPTFGDGDKPIIVHFTGDFGKWIAMGQIQEIKVDTDGRQITMADETTVLKGFFSNNTISGEVFQRDSCQVLKTKLNRGDLLRKTNSRNLDNPDVPAQGGGRFWLQEVEPVKTLAYLQKEVDGKPVLQQMDRYQWKVTNGFLTDWSPCLAYTNCKTDCMSDSDLTGVAHAPWNSIATGRDEGDGWISCEVVVDPLFPFKRKEEFAMGMMSQMKGALEQVMARKGKGKGKGKGKQACPMQ